MSVTTGEVGTDGSVAEGDVRPTGRRLRAARKAQRLTLAQVADEVGLTKGFLSKVERDLATPSVATLLRLCAALGLSIGDLFTEAPDRGDLIRADAYPSIGFGGAGMAESLLTPLRERRLQVIHSVIRPGGGSGDETYELPADVEFVLVLEGELHLTIGTHTHQMATGDAMTFGPQAPHSFRNPAASAVTRVLWVLTPALPIGGSSERPEIAWQPTPHGQP
ncbi:helix-turn-helix domain-containing protein [Nitriliruptor alkaliphilus]|uniref:helix-turn-helix domain-containing protein n=1 Tax=Nitriliruptor alkaliphilus TaxID=427918 RepID=UPI0006970B9A|nr:XRE family transcriptional regulator [Nitriliruptor alkaliphilus]